MPTEITAKKEIEPLVRVAPAPFNRIVKTVFQGGTVTVEELAQLCDVNVAVAERVIAGLMARGLVEDVTP